MRCRRNKENWTSLDIGSISVNGRNDTQKGFRHTKLKTRTDRMVEDGRKEEEEDKEEESRGVKEGEGKRRRRKKKKRKKKSMKMK